MSIRAIAPSLYCLWPLVQLPCREARLGLSQRRSDLIRCHAALGHPFAQGGFKRQHRIDILGHHGAELLQLGQAQVLQRLV